jgi:thiamine kinase-like enzyme
MFLTAHISAYENAQVLHRDVSAGNILITDNGSGILIDWDLSKKVTPEVEAKPRRHSRTV